MVRHDAVNLEMWFAVLILFKIHGLSFSTMLKMNRSLPTLLESTELLLKLLPQKYKDEHNSTAEQGCKLLDGLPLVITLEAGLIRQTLRTLEETFEQL